MRLYSHSRLWLFENCPEAYKIKYIDKTFPDLPKSMSLFLGSMVHDSLEELYKKAMEGEILDMDKMVKHYAENWNKKFTSDIRINGGKIEDYFNKGIKFIIDYYQTHKPFSDNTIELEKRIVFPLDEDKEIGMQGFIDRLEKKGWDEFVVHDYKTNWMMKTQEEVDKDKQLAIYHLGLNKMFGKELKVTLTWHMLAHNKSISSERTSEQLEKLRLDTLKLIREVESNTAWPACGKGFCDWCAYKKANGISMERKGNIGKSVVVENGNLGKWM